MWTKINRFDSADTNVCKYVFEKEDALVEAVLYRYGTFEERTVICCSVMSGCPIGCRFCGTGEYFVRNLTAEEIASQPIHLIEVNKIDATKVKRLQIMTMSMGEPLLNYKNLEGALRILHEKFPNAALLISTSGPKVDYNPFIELSQEIDKIGLQFSVHESTDEARNNLIPFKNKLTLKEIAETGEKWFKATGRKPFFNYCAHDKNTTLEDVKRLEFTFAPEVWECTVSVICERDETIAQAHTRQEKLAYDFSQEMLKVGFGVRTFNPVGQTDTGSGCGQLWFVQEWMKNNPDKVKKTVGYGRNIVHMPQ
jgi:23S rRNA (adenine2503-C2)-methyltransferase